jgi:hypothetical protein
VRERDLVEPVTSPIDVAALADVAIKIREWFGAIGIVFPLRRARKPAAAFAPIDNAAAREQSAARRRLAGRIRNQQTNAKRQ